MHLMWVKSKQACDKLHKLDLVGILFLILGSGLCIIYYEFMCMPFYRNMYIILNSVIAVCVLYTMVCGGDFVSVVIGPGLILRSGILVGSPRLYSSRRLCLVWYR